MQENQLYEYAVIRYLPRVEREEFINVGLVMMCKRRRWIRLEINPDPERLRALGSDLPVEQVLKQLRGFKSIAEGSAQAGPLAQYPVEERFRWLTAAKSACLQSSRPHPGLTTDLNSTFSRLMQELVL
ncbi:MAG: DUF3037 domain-containing protein [Firmicutes bacterium]|nr:DUF3037 domain-containing protein [Bacillota bacterium]MCM1401878.1 DUF3037 domain-containing protein [Bacteroides sp.]MCM1477921.1 DUF3037 domain-containing protein [Bacteroides sp.]